MEFNSKQCLNLCLLGIHFGIEHPLFMQQYFYYVCTELRTRILDTNYNTHIYIYTGVKRGTVRHLDN